MTRREFLARTTALAAAAWATPQLTGSAQREAWARTTGSILDPTGTTLEATIVTIGDGPYFALGYGPGWPQIVREDLASANAGRQDRRVPLATVVHYTDFQLADAQSPARVEFLDASSDQALPFSAAFRPEEAVVPHAVEALVRRTRAINRSPVTGRTADCVVCTGDNIDNTQVNEMVWFRTLMDGGAFAANSGDPDVFEGVQSFSEFQYYQPSYWHPDDLGDPRGPDDYKRLYGFPDYPGMLAAAIQPIQAVGLPMRWYSCYGNHDFLAQGNATPNALFESIATGSTKVLGPPTNSTGARYFDALQQGDAATLASLGVAPARPVTADPDRHLMSPAEYIQAHLDSPASPGPVGHGFTEDNLDPVTLYYTFEVAPGVLGITLDSTAPQTAAGTIGTTQVAWLERQLQAVHSRYYDSAGNEVATGNEDQLVTIFSHHRPDGMFPGPAQRKSDNGFEQGLSGDQLLAVLHRYPNVIAWVNGHSHINRVVAHADASGRSGGIWEITTAAQCDPPQQARIIDVVDNRDGTVSIFTTVIDHGAPPETDAAKLDVLGLASICRELAYNDFQTNAASAIGQPTDLNTELLRVAPFTLSTPPPAPEPDPEPAPQQPDLPATGGGALAATAGAIAIAGAAALRARERQG